MKTHERLSDKILTALEYSLYQEDAAIAELLVNALELSITRDAGGSDFVEKRNYPAEIATALEKYHALKNKTLT